MPSARDIEETVKSIGGKHAAHETRQMVVSAHELAEMLGLSVRTIRRLDCSGKLPRPVRIGGAVRWRTEEITRWLAAGCPDRKEWEALRLARTP